MVVRPCTWDIGAKERVSNSGRSCFLGGGFAESVGVVEVTYLTWTADGLLRHVVYEGLREDKSPREVRRTG